MRVPGVMLLLVLALAPGVIPEAAAQTAATISGIVDDPNRSVLPGVTVTARNVGTALQRTVVTGAEGRYVIPGLPPGTYELRAELSGFKPHVRREIGLTVAQALVLNITLEVGGLSEEVTVTGQTPVINTSSGELSYLVGSDAIERLPLNGRNYIDLALLQPGVLAYPHRDGGSVVAHGLGMSVNGQDPRSNVYLLDGTIQNDFTNGPAGSAAGTSLGTETIREFRVEANAYGAEFGRNSGGQINVLTKSGANTVDGSAYMFHRNDALDARNYFDAGEQPDFYRNQFGATIGGPIAKDRTFFFLGYEALIERLGRTVSTVVPDDNARLGILPSGQVADQRGGGAVPGRVSARQRTGARTGARDLQLPVRSAARRALRAGPPRLQPRIGQPVLRALHARRHRPVPAHRLPAVSPQLHLEESVLHRRIPARVLGEDAEHVAARLQPHRHRPERAGQHVHPAADVHRHARQHGGHRHRRPAPLRSAELRQPAADAERVQRPERPGAHPRPPRDQGRRPGRALSGQHGQPDLQPRHLHVRRPERVPDQPPGQLRRADAGGAVRSLLALHAVRRLRCRTTSS